VAEEDSAPEVDVDQVARIVSSYVRHHQIAPDQLITLIVNVHRALTGLGRSPPVQESPAGGADPALGAAGLCYLP
jgi:predicted transcriptional regulator